MKSIDDVKSFWEANPLWQGESDYEPGSLAYFEEHKKVYIDDCFAGEVNPKIFPDEQHRGQVLDLGCGPGFWTVQLHNMGCKQIVAADLTENALRLAGARCSQYHVENVTFRQENAEEMSFADGVFDHVHCPGVVHHTPDTEAAVAEIARVLKSDGTATIAVYYKNWFLRNWRWISWIGKIFSIFGAKLKGRGREGIFAQDEVNEIVRLYDGKANPIGKAYSRSEMTSLLAPHFQIKSLYLHSFPARTLPFRLPHKVHRFLDKKFGFLIYAELVKK